MKTYIWKFRGVGRITPVRKLVKAFFKYVKYRDGRIVRIRNGSLSGINWKCRDGEQFYMPMGVYEEETAQWIKMSLKKGNVFLDIGANAGYFTMLGAQIVGSSGKVISFEPVPAFFSSIEEKVKINEFENVVIERCVAGGDTLDAVDFIVEDNGANSHIASIAVTHCGSSGQKVIPTAMVKIDDYCREHRLRPDVVKVDVEGAELHVLQGMIETLRACRPRMIISTHSAELKRECRAFLEETGLAVRDLEGFGHELIVE